jgi:hypothetical protein
MFPDAFFNKLARCFSMTTENSHEELFNDFNKIARALEQCSSDPDIKVSDMDRIESDLGRAARALMQCSSDPGSHEMRMKKLESDFGRSARALMQCGMDPGGPPNLKDKLQDDFARAAVALMQCGMDTGRPGTLANLESEFSKAVINLISPEAETSSASDAQSDVQSDFVQAAKALAQCSSDPPNK